MTTIYKRNGYKWNINELLSLQREYELLENTIQEIAIKHKRSVDAILYKLLSENFISNVEQARGYTEYYQQQDYTEDKTDGIELNYSDDLYFNDESTTTHKLDNLSDRIWSLETSVSDINFLVKQMFEVLNEKKINSQRSLRYSK
uniref:Uncharacterized protein n=1 Tax=viral metagenome TaxID=1070528 RepID=A0A6C0EVQ7_9ZZZZ